MAQVHLPMQNLDCVIHWLMYVFFFVGVKTDQRTGLSTLSQIGCLTKLLLTPVNLKALAMAGRVRQLVKDGTT